MVINGKDEEGNNIMQSLYYKLNVRKRIIIIVVGIIVLLLSFLFIIKHAYINHKKIDDEIIEVDKNASIKNFDVNKKFSDLNINTKKELNEYLAYLVNNYLPKGFISLYDFDGLDYQFNTWNWDGFYNGYGIVNDLLRRKGYEELIRRVLCLGNDWEKLPLTDNFVNKFKDKNSVLEYYNVPQNVEYHYLSSDINGARFNVIDISSPERYTYNFSYTLKDELLDNIEFGSKFNNYDQNGFYIAKKDNILMNNKLDVETCLWHVLPYSDYNYYEGDTGYDERTDPYSWYNRDIEIGMTDRFRKEFIEKDGFIPVRPFETFLINKIEVDKKYALVEIELEDKDIYYDITWTTDDEYRLDTISVNVNKEENK